MLALGALLAYAERASRRDEMPAAEAATLRHDAELGWTHAPNLALADLYGAGKSFTTNAAGLRAPEEYAAPLSHRRRRVVFAGDGLTLGAGLGDADAFPARIERLEPRIQSVNLGVVGYGADQAFLRTLRDGEPLDPALIVLALGAPALQRLQSDVSIAPKPRLALEGGRLALRNQPVPARDESALGRTRARVLGWLGIGGDPGRDPAAAAADAELAFAPVAEAMLGELAALAQREGRGLLILYLPTEPELAAAAQPARDWARRAAAERGIAFLDASRALASGAGSAAFGAGGGYSEAGSAIVAAALLPALREALALPPPEPATPEDTGGAP